MADAIDRCEIGHPRDHGGNLDHAVAIYGGPVDEWIDLSTGINRVPYPIPRLPAAAWSQLPTWQDIDALIASAQGAYGTDASVLPVAGAQAAIQLVPRLVAPDRAAVLAPTYNEHAAALRACGWNVDEVETVDELRGTCIAVVVNPNNPDGRAHQPEELMALADHVDWLVVDESFADATPKHSLAPLAGRAGLIVLRSFGKFYGLAGVRLGFVLGNANDLARLDELAGPWAVSGPAIAIGQAALNDRAWAGQTTARLMTDVERLDAMASAAGWDVVGGTSLFRFYQTHDASQAQTALARHRIWSRIFPWSATSVRLGLPGCEREWQRLADALADAGRFQLP